MTNPNKIPKDPNFSKGVNLSGLNPDTILASFDDIDLRNGNQKIHLSKGGETFLNPNGVVKQVTGTTINAAQNAVATNTTPKPSGLAAIPESVKIAVPILAVGIVGGLLFLHFKK